MGEACAIRPKFLINNFRFWYQRGGFSGRRLGAFSKGRTRTMCSSTQHIRDILLKCIPANTFRFKKKKQAHVSPNKNQR